MTDANRKPLIAGNWKMHLDHLEGIQVVQQLAYHLDTADYEAVEVAVCPSFTSLRSIQTLIEGDRLPMALGAQDVHPEPEGAHTGEVSARMLAKLRCRYVIVGHSERRQNQGETDEVVAAKIRAVVAAGMVPILCVGEHLDQRESGAAESVVAGQLRGSLEGVDTKVFSDLVVAYEPVWAIGTGRTASADDANSMCGTVRQVVDGLSPGAGERVRVLYGGSVKPGNAPDLLRGSEVDGALVGGASLDADDFAVICRFHRVH